MYVVVPAGMTLGEARSRLPRHPRDSVFVIRREKDLNVYWHMIVEYVFWGKIERWYDTYAHPPGTDPDAVTLEQAFNLHEWTSVPAVEFGADRPPGPHVVLDGDDVVEVEPPPMAPPEEVGAEAGEEAEADGEGAGPPRLGAGPPETDAAPEPFSAYPGLAAPDIVQAGQAFDLEVWLSETPVAGVHGPGGTARVTVALPAGTPRFDLAVQVVADGFAAPAGWQHILPVDRHRPDATRLRVPLMAEPARAGNRLTSIQVLFSYNGRPCGFAWCNVAVAAGPDLSADQAAGARRWTERSGAAGALLVDAGGAAPDLVAYIAKPDGDPTTGRFAWTYDSPHPVHRPAEPEAIHLGTDAASYAKMIIDTVARWDGQGLVADFLSGVGREIADQIPAGFWDLLAQVRPHVPGGAPSVLLASAESHVPWELAWMDPPLDPARPAFLGAQLPVARWILGTGRAGPPLPPRDQLQVKHVSVILGHYSTSTGWRPLPQAEAEANFLKARYDARQFGAAPDDVRAALGPEHEAQVLHFACHGEVNPTDRDSGIVLENGLLLPPAVFRGAAVGKHGPMAFLNACQVGTAFESLGSYSGFAGAFLRAGFTGFLAPLWSVDDQIAREIAEAFYAEALQVQPGAGRPVAEILRDLRARFGAAGGGAAPAAAAATYMAYVFYGHPDLRLTRIA